MKLLKETLCSQVPINDTDWDLLTKHWNIPKQLKRNEYLSDIGAINRNLYWVIEGTLKICHINNGVEVCLGFAYPNTVVVSYPSFISGKPAEDYIQAITPCQLVAINHQHFYDAIEQNVLLERAWRKITEQALLGRIEREIDLINKTPEERFLRLWKRSPHLFQLVPQKYIASYLRMSAETFSRIKNKVWKS